MKNPHGKTPRGFSYVWASLILHKPGGGFSLDKLIHRRS